MNAHATFSPSAAHRWFACPGSIRLCADLPPRSSSYADEGTAAHELAAMCLQDGDDAALHLGKVINVGERYFTVDEEMADAVQVFLDLVRGFVEDGYELRSEVKLNLEHLWPAQYGTGDAVLFNEATHDLQVVDFKYGKGIAVEPDENPQLLSYLSGAAKLYHNQGVETVSVHIVQPRVPGPQVKSWETTVERLAEFETEFRTAAETASQPNAPLVPGNHCVFCPAAGFCPALRDLSLKIAQAEFKEGFEIVLPSVERLTPKQLGAVMSEVGLVEAWCQSVRDHALASALDGKMPDGFKLVARRTNRRWIDEDRAAGALRTLYELDDEEIYTRKIISPAGVEKLIGKKESKGLGSLMNRPGGGAMLAPLSDKREALSVNALDEFGE
jgi:hypothetical protein